MELLKILINEFDSYDDCRAVITKESRIYSTAYPHGFEVFRNLKRAESWKKQFPGVRIFYAETFTDTKVVVLYELIID